MTLLLLVLLYLLLLAGVLVSFLLWREVHLIRTDTDRLFVKRPKPPTYL